MDNLQIKKNRKQKRLEKTYKLKILFPLFFFSFFLFSEAQTLQDYLDIAVKNNPELEAQQFSYEANKEKMNEVGALPDTKFSVGVFAQAVETRVGAQQVKLSAQQQFPWFGTLKAKQESVRYLAEASNNDVDLIKRNLVLQIKNKYYQLYDLQLKLKIYKENVVILNTFENLALTELETDKASMVDVLRIKIQQNELANKIETIKNDIVSDKKQFNLVLNREILEEVYVPDSLEIKILIQKSTEDDLENHPKLMKLDNITKSLQSNEVVAQKEGLPKISVGLDYSFVQERVDVTLPDNGKDIIMPMVSISIPLLSKKYNSKQQQFKLKQQEIEKRKVHSLNVLRSNLEQAQTAYKNALQDIKTQYANSTEAKRALEVSLATYETGRLDFEQILDLQLLVLKFQLAAVNSEKELLIQRSMLEYLTE
jgi:outer membrane protein TolC